MKHKRKKNEGCSVDMTPMIDVVFQMIIFFIVTLQMTEAKDREVVLEFGPHGQSIDMGSQEVKTSVLIIDIGPKGRISVFNNPVTMQQLDVMVRNRIRAQGNTFQIWIRADHNVLHGYVKSVMDTCSNAGVGRVHIIAVKDPRTEATRQSLRQRGRIAR